MSYYPNAPKNQTGCLETLLIMRVVFGILLIPLLMITGAVGLLVLTLYAATVHIVLALLPMLGGGAGLFLIGRWERRRFQGDLPGDSGDGDPDA